ncbi:MAG: hypothetical protein KatS3mg025_0662 [Bacteroidia bacterium]|nr:MAG: hypothetical protein KatS3mg025_0662 [Bacteroidia bacterium]
MAVVASPPAEGLGAWLDQVVAEDSLELLPQLPAESIDTVFWDPPYFLQIPPAKGRRLKRWKVQTEVVGVQDTWDQFGSFAEYDAFIQSNLEELRRVLKPEGTLWVIGTYHNIHRVGRLLQDLGFWILNDVVWVKSNPMPNWLGVRFTNAVETLIWAVREKEAKGYYFDRKLAQAYGGSSTAPSVWYLPICTGKERLKTAEGKKLHSTQKPEALLERVIGISVPPGGVILDPMAGTGTTGAVAKRLGRHFILIEKEPAYVEAARQRIAKVQTDLFTK